MNDWDSQYYKNHSAAQESRALEILENYVFKGNENVLDIGCGNGFITKSIAEKLPNGQVVGIDISSNMIQLAINDFRHISNLQFIQIGAEDFIFEKKFDLVVSFNALHWMKDHKKILLNIKSSLKNGGKILLLMAAGRNIPYTEEIMNQKLWKKRTVKLQRFLTHMSSLNYDQLLEEIGLKKDQNHIIEFCHNFDSVEEMEHQFMTWLPFCTDLSNEECQNLAKQLSLNVIFNNKNKTKANPLFFLVPMRYVEAHLVM